MTTTYTATALSPQADTLFEEGIERVGANGREHQLLIGGKWRPGAGGTFQERNPGRLTKVIATFARASRGDVEEAVSVARAAQVHWRRTPVAERIEILERALSGIQARAGGFGAAMCLEVGKNRLESMGEVDEALELIRYYARQATSGFEIELEAPSAAYMNRSVLRPFGVFGVIAPFNFPLALLLGPSVAAMLAGNTVVAKPSPTTSLVSVMFAEVLLEAGIPDGVFNLLTGADETGKAVVASPGLDGIVFTGSYAVGQQIMSSFGSSAGYRRPCIIEMGGKNPAIVTNSANLDAAADGIVRSAFGLSGQKCSACSRAIVQDDVHDALLERLVERAREWTVADPVERACRLGPVHTQEAFERYQHNASEAGRDGEVVTGGSIVRDGELDGYYVEPTIVTELPRGHRLIREEQFVPLLVVERVDSLASALGCANDQVYGLTAGIFSGDKQEVETFLDGIEAGTLFVNRAAGATTGGWPGQQTYPGWKGSGSTGRGALGPRYVEQFLREQGHNIVDPDAG
jgi:1-pyrroline-5-carboxylate dehydrogenase